jgi:hypothetical protein
MPARRARSTPLRVKGKWPPPPARKAASASPAAGRASGARSSRSPPTPPSSTSRSRRAAAGKRGSPLPAGTLAVSPLGLFAAVSRKKAAAPEPGAKRASSTSRRPKRAQPFSSSSPKRRRGPTKQVRARASLRVEQAGSGEMVQRYRVVRVLPGGAVVGQEVRVRVVRRPAAAAARRASPKKRRSFSPVKPLRILN